MTNTFHFEGEQKRERAFSDKNEECEYRLFAIVQYPSDSTACGSFTNLVFECGGVPIILINGEKSESKANKTISNSQVEKVCSLLVMSYRIT